LTYKPTHLSDQLWSMLFVLAGATIVIVFHRFAIPADAGIAVIGAGLQSFTSAAKNQTNVNSVVTTDSSVK
jgi:hypothetical protein